MGNSITSEQFNGMGMKKNADGTYSKVKTALQPRDLKVKLKDGKEAWINKDQWDAYNAFKRTGGNFGKSNLSTEEREQIIQESISESKKEENKCNKFRKVSLTLFGSPMPKQSVRAYITKQNTIGTYQPPEMGAKVRNYQEQIKSQLPKDFVMFTEIVHVRKMHFVFPPLKAFSRVKGKMDAIRNGEKFYKTTKPDLGDNLQKLIWDSLTGLVYKDDSLIVSENNVEKYYGVGGCIILELEGY